MNNLKLLILLFPLWAFSQEIPELADEVLVCHDGVFPDYIVCEDSIWATQSFYPDGQVKTEGKLDQGMKARIWKSYYDISHTVMSMGEIKDSRPFGKWLFYYESGQKKAEGSFDLGKFELGCAGSGNFKDAAVKIGSWSFWNEDGSLYLNCHFAKNEYGEESLNGKYTEFFTDGNTKAEGNYKNGMKNGRWTYFYPSGQKEREEFYLYKDCGMYDYIWYECPTGTWKYWNEKGEIIKTEEHGEESDE